MTTEPCYFLELPKELRLQIYDYLLRPACIRLCTYDSPTIVGLSQDEIASTRVYHQFTSNDPPMELHPHILRACHQVYDEASASLHKPYTLQIEPSWGGPFQQLQDQVTGKTVLRNFDAARLCNVRILPILCIELCTSPLTGNEDIAHSTLFANILRTVSEVKKLELCISDAWEEDHDGDSSEEQTYFSNLESMIKIWGDTNLKTDIHVWFKNIGNRVSWCKGKGGEWREDPDSDSVSACASPSICIVKAMLTHFQMVQVGELPDYSKQSKQLSYSKAALALKAQCH
ncbi:hypothetical protein LTR27_007043 [Elasticomyces elasticus]|nr:hypothetical protein LTR27_007043 [Elasticomyces elasticus]